MKVVRALEGEPLRQGRRKETLYLIRGCYYDLRAANLTKNIDHADKFLSETGAANIARRMGLTEFEVVDL